MTSRTASCQLCRPWRARTARRCSRDRVGTSSLSCTSKSETGCRSRRWSAGRRIEAQRMSVLRCSPHTSRMWDQGCRLDTRSSSQQTSRMYGLARRTQTSRSMSSTSVRRERPSRALPWALPRAQQGKQLCGSNLWGEPVWGPCVLRVGSCYLGRHLLTYSVREPRTANTVQQQ